MKLSNEEYQKLSDKFPKYDKYGVSRESNTNLYIWFFNNVIVPNVNNKGDNHIETVQK